MTPEPNPYHRHRFPAEIISHAVWLYHVFSLSLRDVELILAERGVLLTLGRWSGLCGWVWQGPFRFVLADGHRLAVMIIDDGCLHADLGPGHEAALDFVGIARGGFIADVIPTNDLRIEAGIVVLSAWAERSTLGFRPVPTAQCHDVSIAFQQIEPAEVGRDTSRNTMLVAWGRANVEIISFDAIVRTDAWIVIHNSFSDNRGGGADLFRVSRADRSRAAPESADLVASAVTWVTFWGQGLMFFVQTDPYPSSTNTGSVSSLQQKQEGPVW
jgi:hypothetical protein